MNKKRVLFATVLFSTLLVGVSTSAALALDFTVEGANEGTDYSVVSTAELHNNCGDDCNLGNDDIKGRYAVGTVNGGLDKYRTDGSVTVYAVDKSGLNIPQDGVNVIENRSLAHNPKQTTESTPSPNTGVIKVWGDKPSDTYYIISTDNVSEYKSTGGIDDTKGRFAKGKMGGGQDYWQTDGDAYIFSNTWYGFNANTSTTTYPWSTLELSSNAETKVEVINENQGKIVANKTVDTDGTVFKAYYQSPKAGWNGRNMTFGIDGPDISYQQIDVAPLRKKQKTLNIRKQSTVTIQSRDNGETAGIKIDGQRYTGEIEDGNLEFTFNLTEAKEVEPIMGSYDKFSENLEPGETITFNRKPTEGYLKIDGPDGKSFAVEDTETGDTIASGTLDSGNITIPMTYNEPSKLVNIRGDTLIDKQVSVDKRNTTITQINVTTTNITIKGAIDSEVTLNITGGGNEIVELQNGSATVTLNQTETTTYEVNGRYYHPRSKIVGIGEDVVFELETKDVDVSVEGESGTSVTVEKLDGQSISREIDGDGEITETFRMDSNRSGFKVYGDLYRNQTTQAAPGDDITFDLEMDSVKIDVAGPENVSIQADGSSVKTKRTDGDGRTNFTFNPDNRYLNVSLTGDTFKTEDLRLEAGQQKNITLTPLTANITFKGNGGTSLKLTQQNGERTTDITLDANGTKTVSYRLNSSASFDITSPVYRSMSVDLGVAESETHSLEPDSFKVIATTPPNIHITAKTDFAQQTKFTGNDNKVEFSFDPREKFTDVQLMGSGINDQNLTAKAGKTVNTNLNSSDTNLMIKGKPGTTVYTSSNESQNGSRVAVGEVGVVDVSADTEWRQVDLKRRYNDPVVVTSPLGYSGQHPAHTRIRAVQNDSFQIRVEEWSYLNEKHAIETVNYMVVEEGTYTLSTGEKIEAGTATTDDGWSTVDFDTQFQNPIVFSEPVTYRSDDPVTDRHQNVDKDGFEVRLQEEEKADRPHRSEELDYVAIEGVNAKTSQVKHKWKSLDTDSAKALFAETQSFRGNDPASLRMKDGEKVMIHEEKSMDNEVSHTPEEVGYISFNPGLLYENRETSGSGENSSSSQTSGADEPDRKATIGNDGEAIISYHTGTGAEYTVWGPVYQKTSKIGYPGDNITFVPRFKKFNLTVVGPSDANITAQTSRQRIEKNTGGDKRARYTLTSGPSFLTDVKLSGDRIEDETIEVEAGSSVVHNLTAAPITVEVIGPSGYSIDIYNRQTGEHHYTDIDGSESVSFEMDAVWGLNVFEGQNQDYFRDNHSAYSGGRVVMEAKPKGPEERFVNETGFPADNTDFEETPVTRDRTVRIVDLKISDYRVNKGQKFNVTAVLENNGPRNRTVQIKPDGVPNTTEITPRHVNTTVPESERKRVTFEIRFDGKVNPRGEIRYLNVEGALQPVIEEPAMAATASRDILDRDRTQVIRKKFSYFKDSDTEDEFMEKNVLPPVDYNSSSGEYEDSSSGNIEGFENMVEGMGSMEIRPDNGKPLNLGVGVQHVPSNKVYSVKMNYTGLDQNYDKNDYIDVDVVNASGGEITDKTNFTAPLYDTQNHVKMTLSRSEVNNISNSGELYLRLRTDEPQRISVENMSLEVADDTLRYVHPNIKVSNTVVEGGLRQDPGELELSASVKNFGRSSGTKKYTLFRKRPGESVFRGVDTKDITVNPGKVRDIKFFDYAGEPGTYEYRIGPDTGNRSVELEIDDSGGG